ncbi:hypothetical protein F2Q69_00007730 [Brassica cretica]|uniref:Uncharacterized protein n=1 Tax=Brassica cretica TaxID=69181 RepID=A0A8S9PFW9_BRACR|nr:hypothetical protein F2Q69_00007730 [Brassica cretica]
MTIGTRTNQARSLRYYRTCTLSSRYVATELEPKLDRAFVPLGQPKLGCYVATERLFRSVATDRARAKARSLRSDRAFVPLGRYVAIEPEPKLGRYEGTERPFRSVAM